MDTDREWKWGYLQLRKVVYNLPLWNWMRNPYIMINIWSKQIWMLSQSDLSSELYTDLPMKAR